MNDSTMSALQHLRDQGFLVDALAGDGEIHRVPLKDKPRRKDGAYIYHPDNPATLWWQNHSTGQTGTWKADADPLPDLPAKGRHARAERWKEEAAQRRAAQAERQQLAAHRAQKLYQEAAEAAGHAYLARKGVGAVPGLRCRGKVLVCPLYDAAGGLVNLQSITADGQKRFLAGARKRGCFFPIGKDAAAPLLICEGLATGLSLHVCTGYPVLVAFDAGNLLPVAECARAAYPERKIILCADNDVREDGSTNIGVAKATAAAKAVQGQLVVPVSPDGGKVDWNDLHQAHGQEVVWQQYLQSLAPEKEVGEVGEVGEPYSAYPSGHSDPLSPESEKSERAEGTAPGFVLIPKGKKVGLWHMAESEDGPGVETWIGPPLYVLGATRDASSNAWGLLLQWHDPDGQPHTWAMARSLLMGHDAQPWLGRLADEGWTGAPGRTARNLLALYLATCRTERRALCVPRTGWHDGVYVLPESVIGERSGERIVLQVQSSHNPYQTGGSFESWQTTIGGSVRGNSRLMLAVCAALGAVLLEPSGQESGGFNLIGGSSTGKTTALQVAGSVWGKGASPGGYIQSWRATANGLEGLAALHSDALLCLDEIGQAPGKAVSEASYMLANGMGKARAFQDGSARVARSWRCMVLSTGEMGLAGKIAEEGGRVQAGQSVRLIDVPADAGQGYGIFDSVGPGGPQAFADSIKFWTSRHYGHLARHFIAAFQSKREEATASMLLVLQNELEAFCPAKADGQVKRVARRFLLCAIAGEMAAEWGLLPWRQGEALGAMQTCFAAWLADRGGVGAAEDTAILEQVFHFLEQHGSSRFQDLDAKNPYGLCINRAGYRRQYGQGMEYLILPESFKAEVCRGFSYRRVLHVLEERGILIPGEGKNKGRKPDMSLPGFGANKRCYTLRIGTDTEAEAGQDTKAGPQ